jgi:hypothetical protein
MMIVDRIDIFSVQDEICKNIMVALQVNPLVGVKLTEGEMVRINCKSFGFINKAINWVGEEIRISSSLVF